MQASSTLGDIDPRKTTVDSYHNNQLTLRLGHGDCGLLYTDLPIWRLGYPVLPDLTQMDDDLRRPHFFSLYRGSF